jgi:hypothetical protein
VSEIVYDPKRKGGQLLISRTLDYFGFELERETEVIEDFTPEIAPKAIRALAEALANGQARHLSVKKNRAAVDDIRQTYRRSGGETARLKFDDLAGWYERELAGITSMNDFRNARLFLNRDEFVPRDVREKYAALPDSVVIRDREVDIEYDVEDENGDRRAVARLRLPEKLARGLSESELPTLDRPIRFVVIRGQRGALRANTLDELQEALDAPWSPDEIGNDDRGDEHASMRRIALASLRLIIVAERAEVTSRGEIRGAAGIAGDIRAVARTERAANRGVAGARVVNFADDDLRLPQAFHRAPEAGREEHRRIGDGVGGRFARNRRCSCRRQQGAHARKRRQLGRSESFRRRARGPL